VPLEECHGSEPGGPWKPWIEAELDTLAQELGWRGRPWLGGGSIDRDEVNRQAPAGGADLRSESEAR